MRWTVPAARSGLRILLAEDDEATRLANADLLGKPYDTASLAAVA
ncbi:hypothetical protein [Rugamonas sp.]|nr:hypothetical protein [Rugamonas sp.]